MKPLSLIVLALFSHGLFAADKGVLSEKDAGGPPKQMMSRYLHRLANDAFERRKKAYEARKTLSK